MGANLSVLVIGSENDVWKCTDETGSIDLVALLGVLEQQAENDTNWEDSSSRIFWLRLQNTKKRSNQRTEERMSQ
jgi:hypothetical protein